MEWVETTAKSVDEAKDLALERLAVARQDAEFEVLEEPRTGLFGRVRGEARVRARVAPAPVRPKQERRGRGRKSTGRRERTNESSGTKTAPNSSRDAEKRHSRRSNGRSERPARKEEAVESSRNDEPTVTPEEVGAAAVTFLEGLVDAIGAEATTSLTVEGTELDVSVTGSDIGLLVGPGGRTLMAVQDLTRVASQRRLGDHDTRLRVDVGDYRVRRKEALEKFAMKVADEVVASGEAKALEPMNSADRKVIHDVLNEHEAVTSHSDGDDPARRVIISPA